MSDALDLPNEAVWTSWFTAVIDDLRARPGRLADTIRLVVLVITTVAIGETFRMPEIAVSAYVVLFISRNERTSTVLTGVVAGLAVICGVFVTIAVFMASLSEPALRVPLIAIATFAALFLARVSPLGPAAFAACFIVAYGLTVGDQVLGLSLQSTGSSNTTEAGLPALLSIPMEEALLQFLLWLAPAVALPVALVVVGNLLTGRRPELLLRAGLADRLAACARFCAGEPGAERVLTESAREGSAGFAKLHRFSGTAPRPPDYTRLISETEQLALALLAWPMIATPDQRHIALASCAKALREAERSLRTNIRLVAEAPVPLAITDAAKPLTEEIARSSAAIFRALNAPPASQPKATRTVRHLISADAVRDPETTRFALKVTLAVMLSYAAESLLDWPAIHTCVVTCFFVSLGTIGESIHKATLRVVGALTGGALGIASILLLMPLMTNIGELLLALAAVTFLAGWVANGSERISYAGWQIGLAYYLSMLQGYGPTLDMQSARDRVIGIVLGNLIVLVVFTTIWPVSVAQAVRREVARAIGALAAGMRIEKQAPSEALAARTASQMGFAAATAAARRLMANAGYERIAPLHNAGGRKGGGQIDIGILAELDAIMLVLCVVLNLQSDPAWLAAPAAIRQAVFTYHDEMANWFDSCAAWVGTGAGGDLLEAGIPLLPELAAPSLAVRAAWYRVLDRELRATMSLIMHRANADG